MKKKLILLGASAAAIIFTGCAGTNVPAASGEKGQMVQVTNNLPAWVINPKVEGGISSVGVTGYSKHGMEIMLPQAEMDARAKLAGQIQTVISQLQQKSMRGVKINEIDEFEKSFKSATKEVVKKMPLSGAQRINIFQANDGTLYIHMVIEKREVSKHIGDMKNTYKQHMEQAKLSRDNIDEGMKVLDDMMKELDVEMK